jgi:outer membrane immunogenic protein
MKKLLLAAVSALAMVSTAQAADLGAPRSPIAAAVIAPAFSWTGFYLGGQVGYGWLSGRSAFNNGTNPLPVRSTGFLGGIHAGYNYQISNVVLGAEADLEYTGIRGFSSDPVIDITQGRFDLRWQGSVRLRAGLAVDRALIYATGGLALADFRLMGGPLFGVPTSYNVSRTGWTVGAGVEYAFAPNWTARAEYRYADYGTVSRDIGVIQTTSLRSHTVRLGVSYLFSTGPSAVVARY